MLNGNVVDLAVGVVVGMAFTLLMQAFTEDFLTPALGAVFAGEGAGGCVCVGDGGRLAGSGGEMWGADTQV